MKSIIIDYRLADSGGIGRFISGLLQAIKHQPRVTLILRKKQPIPLLSFEFDVIRFYSKPLSLFEQIEYLFKLPSADILFLPFINIPILFFLARPSSLVPTIHDLFHIDYKSDKSIFIRTIYKIYLYFIMRFASHVFTVSYFSMRRLLNIYPLSPPISVLYNGVNPIFNHFSSSDNLTSISLNNTNIVDFCSSNSPPLLFVGNQKTHKNLVSVLNYLASDETHRLLVVGSSIGTSSNESFVHEYSQYLGLGSRVLFAGKISDSDLIYCYKNSFCLLFPSHYEGFGIPLIESQAMGTPVICSDIDVFHEIGVDSCIYIEPSPSGIKKGIQYLESISPKQRSELILKGRHNANRFTWDRSACSFVKIMQSLQPTFNC